MWRQDGKELIYHSPDGKLMAVPVRSAGQSLAFGSAEALFSVPPFYGMFADAQRFLVATPEDASQASRLVVVIR